MKKKEIEYTPQFDFDNEAKPLRANLRKCSNCQKESVSVVDGLCFYCRKEKMDDAIPSSAKNARTEPNEELFNVWLKNQRSNSFSPFLAAFRLGCLWHLLAYPLTQFGFAGLVIIVGIIMLVMATETIVFGILGVALIGLGIYLCILQKKASHRKFSKYCSTIVSVYYSSQWTCPCCKFGNDKLCHCERCGVLPLFSQK